MPNKQGRPKTNPLSLKEQRRINTKRCRDRAKKQGKRRIDLTLSSEAYEKLCEGCDKRGMSFNEYLDMTIMNKKIL